MELVVQRALRALLKVCANAIHADANSRSGRLLPKVNANSQISQQKVIRSTASRVCGGKTPGRGGGMGSASVVVTPALRAQIAVLPGSG